MDEEDMVEVAAVVVAVVVTGIAKGDSTGSRSM